MKRYLEQQVLQDLKRKMVFVGGPRQTGKTTLAKTIAKKLNGQAGYLNWDHDEDRESILRRQLPPSPLWIFDEIHKYRQWRQLLKGLYDKTKDHQKILVTGSARLDYYRYSGDSLQGRYHFLRLHPITLDELPKGNSKDFEMLLQFGGFPEPFLSGKRFDADRWSREYRSRLIREDILSIETIQEVGKLEQLILRLPELVGSPLSINGLREDLQINFKTASQWIEILERFYAIYRVAPFGSPRIKAVKKEQKHYHYDWNLIKEPGRRFENVIASHLLKWCHHWEDTQGRDFELKYFRDSEQREVDFVVTEAGKPRCLIEVKLTDTQVSPHLTFLKRKFPEVPAFQVIREGRDFVLGDSGIRVGPAATLLLEIKHLLGNVETDLRQSSGT